MRLLRSPKVCSTNSSHQTLARAVQIAHDEVFPSEYSSEELAEIKTLSASRVTVVGIDIYHYSRFALEKQMFIPHLHELIYFHTWHLIKQNYDFLFQEYGPVMDREADRHINQAKHFIGTGDGGYQILPTPLHGIIYVLTFATILRLYNSDKFMRKLHARIGNIEVRYAITLDQLNRFRESFYGAAIINNARMLSKDRLDQLLIDHNVYNWFLDSMIGVENLLSIDLEDVQDYPDFSAYDKGKVASRNNALIKGSGSGFDEDGFRAVDVQKIGELHPKGTPIDVYNLHMQALIHYQNLFGHERIFNVSVGNLNTSGIDDEA